LNKFCQYNFKHAVNKTQTSRGLLAMPLSSQC